MAHNLSNITEEDQRGRAQEGKRQFCVRNDDWCLQKVAGFFTKEDNRRKIL